MITSLEDINQPYSCEQWGNSGAFGIPPIIDCGTTEDINPHHVFIGNNANEFPQIIAFDKFGNVIYKSSKITESLIQKIEDALSIEYIPNDVPLIGEQNPTSCPNLIIGCMNPNSCNYNANANYDSDDCTYAQQYYNCDGECIVDTDGDGICDEIEVSGCTVESACNYSDSSTDDDGSCTYPEQYYNCDGVCITDTDEDGVCDELEVSGCTVESACNYSDSSTDDDGSCTYPEQYYNCDGVCITDTDEDGVCDENELSINDKLIPVDYNINTIYPNPFNPLTTISFSIPQSGLVSLKVYDITGRITTTLKDEYMSVGYYDISWDASNYPSGIYFVKMVSGGYVKMEKVVLVK